ncbi:MAG: hypothetical protein ABR596_07365, partial [Halarsenatibacteraceae bacterium]
PETFDVNLSVDPEGSGAVNGSGTYQFGDSVSIEATSEKGYKFVNWTEDDNDGAVVSTDASYTFGMPADDVNYTANFVIDDNQFATVTFISGDNGSLEGDTEFTVLKGTEFGDIDVPDTVGDPGYMFDEWDPELPANTDEVDEDATYTALFVRDDVEPGELVDYESMSFEGQSVNSKNISNQDETEIEGSGNVTEITMEFSGGKITGAEDLNEEPLNGEYELLMLLEGYEGDNDENGYEFSAEFDDGEATGISISDWKFTVDTGSVSIGLPDDLYLKFR